MSDVTPDEDDDTERNWRKLEQRAEDAEARAARAEELERRNAFLEAGVDLKSEHGQLLYDGYKGDLDVEAIQAKWTAIAPQPAAEPPPEVPAEDAAQTRERASLAADTAPPAALTDKNPKRAGIEEFHRLREEEGYSLDEASVPFFDRLFTAARDRDPRIEWNEQAQREHQERAAQYR